MSAAASPSRGPAVRSSSPWTEHRNAQGRVYWYHQIEKRSVWEKPSELKTARERALDSTPWKEYQSGDRKYYVHSVTKESLWTLPAELKALFDSIPEDGSPAVQTPTHVVQDSNSPFPIPTPQRPVYSGPPPGFASPNGSGAGSASPAPPQTIPAAQFVPQTGVQVRMPPNNPTVATTGVVGLPPTGPRAGGGEEAFLQLLRDKNIDGTWTWEATMREIITEPLYKALGTLAERKAAFSKHIRNLAAEAENAKRERAKAIEPSIRAMMRSVMAAGGGDGEMRVQPWLSYEGMLLRCPDASKWRQLEAVGETEARQLWDTLRNEAREAEQERQRTLRRRNMDVFMKLLTSFEADVSTRWKDARQTVLESDEWRSDEQLREISVTDMISVFDELIRSIEKQKTQDLQDAKTKRQREARQRRDWFRGVLKDGKQQGWLTIRTTFGDVYERLRAEERLQAMLGQPGSTPLELFHDALDELDVEMGKVLRAVEKVLSAAKPAIRVTASTDFAEFTANLKEAISKSADDSTDAVRLAEKSDDELRVVFDELVQLGKEEARRIERKLRHLGEDLRYALKKLAYHEPQTFDVQVLDQSWEEVWKAKLEALHLREWEAFERTTFRIAPEQIDEARQAAWRRFVERQKEKLAERQARAASAEAAAAAAAAAGEAAPRKRRERHERRSGIIDESSIAKRARRESAVSERDPNSSGKAGAEDDDSEKEEGEV